MSLANSLVPMHGLGGAKDLPIPLELAVAGATAALIVSFCVLALAWRTPRYQDPRPGRPAPAALVRVVDSAWFQWVLRVLGLLFAAYIAWALIWGPDLVVNPALGTFYVLVWVGLVPVSVLFGPVVRAVSPVRTINLLLAKLTGGDPAAGMSAYPARLGYWPAAVSLFAFVLQELVNPQSAYLSTVRLWLAGYLAVMLVGAAIFGDEWFERSDPFEVYSNLVAKLSPWGRDGDRLVLRSPLANLATLTPRPGLVAVVAVLFGSTAFDSYKDTLAWQRFIQDVGLNPTFTNAAGLLSFCLIVGGTFTAAAMLTGVDRSQPGAVRRRALPDLLAYSVIPIIVGYITAHYLSYLIEQGQTTIIQLSDPMVRGDNLLGTGNWSVNYWLSFHPTLLAVIQVLAVVTGHIVAVIAAHDRAIKLLPPRHHVTGQIGMLVVMVAYTATGLYLLMGGF
ncbi:MAG: hypothetical protein JWR85_2354 [Marmoricola sp.]|nr:hypothetical protein [Marmoricola sp.]